MREAREAEKEGGLGEEVVVVVVVEGGGVSGHLFEKFHLNDQQKNNCYKLSLFPSANCSAV